MENGTPAPSLEWTLFNVCAIAAFPLKSAASLRLLKGVWRSTYVNVCDCVMEKGKVLLSPSPSKLSQWFSSLASLVTELLPYLMCCAVLWTHYWQELGKLARAELREALEVHSRHIHLLMDIWWHLVEERADSPQFTHFPFHKFTLYSILVHEGEKTGLIS